MFRFDNPVLNRELLVNLRTFRSFILLFIYQAVLAAVVYFAWPKERLDLSENSDITRPLVNSFFLGQYILACLMAPSFAAGAISGEKERKTYEMLLASPLMPSRIVWGKLVAALMHLAILIFASLPVVMLCLPLGGVSIYEVLTAYVVVFCSVITFGMISVASGSFFSRTASSLVVSYLVILILALCVVGFWVFLETNGELRIILSLVLIPGVTAAITIPLFYITSARLLYPPDMGSEGKEVVDLETEAEQAIGLVIQRDQFPDRLFAPPKRETLMLDGTNPVYDKEMRSEIFGQGTLMLRLAIQISMVLAIPLMALFLYIYRSLAPWYICYVTLFNILVGPVFSAGSVTGERERQTLDLLLTTTITPWQILKGKLISGLRVSSVLTSFLMWPVFLALVMVPDYWSNLPTMLAYIFIFLLTCFTTANIALFCSTVFRKSITSLIVTYLLILGLFLVPIAIDEFSNAFIRPAQAESAGLEDADEIRANSFLTISSPFAAAHRVPIYVDDLADMNNWSKPSIGDAQMFGYKLADLRHFGYYVSFTLGLNCILFGLMIWMFNNRWRVSSSTG